MKMVPTPASRAMNAWHDSLSEVTVTDMTGRTATGRLVRTDGPTSTILWPHGGQTHVATTSITRN